MPRSPLQSAQTGTTGLGPSGSSNSTSASRNRLDYATQPAEHPRLLAAPECRCDWSPSLGRLRLRRCDIPPNLSAPPS